MVRGIINTTKFTVLVSLMICTHLFGDRPLALQPGLLLAARMRDVSVDPPQTTAAGAHMGTKHQKPNAR